MPFRKSRFARLVGHFFAGFLDNDLLTSACIVLSRIMESAVLAPKTQEMFDPGAYVAAPLFLAIVALGAVLAPARRATRIDPIAALRQE